MGLVRMELAGSPGDIGRQQGRACPKLIERAYDYYCPFSEEELERLSARVGHIEGTLAQRAPEALVEIQGIAKGAGMAYEKVLLLNIFAELRSVAATSCTAVGFSVTREGPLIGKTDDVSLSERELEVYQRIRPSKGYEYIQYAIAGTIWSAGGINEWGLAQAMTGLIPKDAYNPQGIPALISNRWVLERCATIEEGIALLAEADATYSGMTVMLADGKTEEIVVVEKYAGVQAERWAGGKHIVATNHCHCPETQALEGGSSETRALGYDPGLIANSRARHENAVRLAKDAEHTREGMRELLSDHSTYGAVCQHGQAGLHTSVAMVLIPNVKAMWVAEGSACDPKWLTWRV